MSLVACGGKITSSGTIIQSTNYPDPYLALQHCDWVIVFPQNEKITLEFLAFDLEFESMCRYDWLEVRDGNTSDSTLIGHPLCGEEVPDAITSTGNTLFMRFSSDGSVIKPGFKINVTISHLPGICIKIYTLNNIITMFGKLIWYMLY